MKNILEPVRFRNGVWAPNRLALAALTNSQRTFQSLVKAGLVRLEFLMIPNYPA